MRASPLSRSVSTESRRIIHEAGREEGKITRYRRALQEKAPSSQQNTTTSEGKRARQWPVNARGH